jgi:hypothetical protein
MPTLHDDQAATIIRHAAAATYLKRFTSEDYSPGRDARALVDSLVGEDYHEVNRIAHNAHAVLAWCHAALGGENGDLVCPSPTCYGGIRADIQREIHEEPTPCDRCNGLGVVARDGTAYPLPTPLPIPEGVHVTNDGDTWSWTYRKGGMTIYSPGFTSLATALHDAEDTLAEEGVR